MYRRFLSLVLIIWAFEFAFSETETIAPKINYVFSKLQTRGQFNGVVLAEEKGRILYTKAFGYSDLETKKPLSAEAVFEVASLTKTFTAMGIFILKERGELRFEDDIRMYFPNLPYERITIRHLLTHTSGLQSYLPFFLQYWDQNKIPRNSDVPELLSQRKIPLHFAPGNKWEYSNTGYVLLASIIEKVSKMDYGSFLKKNIFEPLKMENTIVRSQLDQKIPALASGYVRESFIADRYVLPETLPRFRFEFTLGGIIGDHGVCSTAEDLLRWNRALNTEKLIKRNLFREVIAPVKLNDGSPALPIPGSNDCRYGMGWFLRKGEKGSTELWHTGSWPGYASYMVRNLELDQTILILANTNDSAVPAGMNVIQNIMAGRTYSFPKLSVVRAIGKIVINDGVSAAIEKYHELKKHSEDDYNFSEQELNNLGYALLEKNKVSDAIAIFKLNVEVFPDSWNVYDSLGEAYLKDGNAQLAIQNYEKSIQMNPKNGNGIAVLKRLKELSGSSS